MPRGPRGEQCPADVIGNAVMVGRLSVGLDTEELKRPSGRVRSGHAGAKAGAANMSEEGASRWLEGPLRHGEGEIVKMARLQPNKQKILESVLFLIELAEKETYHPTQYELVKSIFIADFHHLKKYGRPITFDNYSAMELGP